MPTPRPSDLYRDHLQQHHLQQDQQQIVVLQSFDRLCQSLNSNSSFFSRLFRYAHNDIRLGIYVWGTVGIGKTFLMDCFYNALTTTKKRRIHFHHFMQEIHAALQQYSGRADPLSLVAKSIRAHAEVLCLDEFFVSDIVDAMLLAGLLKALFKEGVCFVTTSNIPPNQLYADGLQRKSFLPAIALLEQNLEIIHLLSTTDYRLLHLKSAGTYYTPLNADAEHNMEAAFQLYATMPYSTQALSLLGRKVSVIKSCAEAVWFDFDVLCGPMRSKQDYLALAKQFPVIFLSHVPVFNHRSLDEITCFIQLIDIFYDAKIKLVISADAPANLLYTEGKLIFEFQRIASRLMEMQSAEYFDL
ncbi:MAG: cell division protein ZapE [Pseudomonadota bacterium]